MNNLIGFLKKLSAVIAKIQSILILTLTYFLILWPAVILMQLLSKKYQRLAKSNKSNWQTWESK